MTNLGEQFNQLLKRFEEEEKTRKDIVIPLAELTMKENGNMSSLFFGELPLGDSALSQICSNLRLPTEYMKRLQKVRPDLVAEQVNYFLNNMSSLGFKKVRIKNNMIQGFVGENYVPFDNLDFLNVFADSVKGLDNLDIKYHDITDRKFHMRVVFNDMVENFGYDINGKKDNLYIGFDLENSEIGFRSIKLTPVVWRLVCSNGLRRVYAKGEVLKQRHSNFMVDDLRRRMSTSIYDSIESGAEIISALKGSRSVKVFNAQDKLEEIGKEFNLTKKKIEVVKHNFNFDPENSLYGIVNAFTRTARDIGDNEQRLELETLASKILTRAS